MIDLHEISVNPGRLSLLNEQYLVGHAQFPAGPHHVQEVANLVILLAHTWYGCAHERLTYVTASRVLHHLDPL